MLIRESIPTDMQTPFAELITFGMLERAPLYGDRYYYYLSPKAIGLFPHNSLPRMPLNEAQKIRDYAISDFCRSTGAVRLLPEDFQVRLTGYEPPAVPTNYYRIESMDENSTADQLGFLRVDCGGRGRWDRILGKLARDALRHVAADGFRTLFQNQSFELALLTATYEKADRIYRQLQQHPLPADAVVRIHVVPDLLELIAPAPRLEPLPLRV